jgi:carbon monoxide dehydrogenase subunit G
MQVEGQYTINAPIDRVWAYLQDPAGLQACIPGCEKLEPRGDDSFEATLKVGVAAVKGTYQGKVTIADKEPPRRYRMLVEGSGGPGFVRGEAAIELSATDPNTTLVQVKGDGQVGGTVAGVGQRMLGGVAKMLMKQMFDCVKARVEAANSPP